VVDWYGIFSTFVIARAEKPVAIHCDRGNEEKGHAMSNPNASIAYSGLPRRSLRSLLAMTLAEDRES
jgi:hypothetical protein